MEKKGNYIFTSESVTEGHPDKVADQISDSILDSIIAQDKKCRVACETLVTTGIAMVAGEITTACWVDIPSVVRETIKEIGYNDSGMGFDWQTCSVLTSIDKQSPDISVGVTEGTGLYKEQGAGDQGLMFGYACNETSELMPLPIMLAHKLTRRLSFARKNNILDFLRPDGKSQVSVVYEDDEPKYVDTVVVSTQHKPDIEHGDLKDSIIGEVIKKVVPEKFISEKTKYYVNPTGRFVVGGPMGDTGLTGRKIIVDTYGGVGRHGGGCFSGKDPSKVDRSASYMARHVAKNVVASGLASKCEVQIAYAIGVADPVSVMINCLGTNKYDENAIYNAVREVFLLKPRDIIQYLDLLRPIYKKTASYGHFGRDDDDFIWEKTHRVDELKTAVRH